MHTAQSAIKAECDQVTADKPFDAIGPSKRILALVDDYEHFRTAATRTALRKALLTEFQTAFDAGQACRPKTAEGEDRRMLAATHMADMWRLQRQYGGGFPRDDVDEFLAAFPAVAANPPDDAPEQPPGQSLNPRIARPKG